ncbi:unnamed protein product [Ostreobium quekettii]|uniref:Uncharacterized protein n=1 Tax=Ostreobium quekettii TaxID=121088 RepID=A0A8S1INY8_9CHLO|nr:unnamed protein product [Ostreobium quekettii]|eukprot:evm.model.scf_132.4 EVM.evm.TU.scf_132.4   scf_132:118344-120778(+)
MFHVAGGALQTLLRRCALAGQLLASEFSHYISDKGVKAPLKDRAPSHLLPPNAVVAAQMDALQMNDWPEADAGVKTAFLFAKPPDQETMLPGQGCRIRARSWLGKEEWLNLNEFSDMVHSSPYDVLLDCDSWQEISQVVFPSTRFERAVQAVEVEEGISKHISSRQRPHRFTFLLEKVKEGSYKNCWMTIGVRYGDYANC